MATRRRGGADLSDLKAQLGIQEAPEPEPEVPGEPEPAASGDAGHVGHVDAGAPAYADAHVGGESGYADPAAAAAYADEDYGAAVSSAEEVKEIRIEATDRDEAFNANPKFNFKAVIPLAAVFIVALFLGTFYGSASGKNESYNAQISDAQRMIEVIQPLANNLSSLRNDLEAITVQGYSEDFDARLAQAYSGSGRITLEATQLNTARALLGLDQQIGPQLVSLASNTQLLRDLVERHQATTRREMDEIQREIAGNTDSANYAIVFDSAQQGQRYGAFMENAEANPYIPIAGFKVTYDELVPTMEGTGNNQRPVFTVTFPNGQPRTVPIYEVIPLDRAQLIERTSNETAISRYVQRAVQIRENVEAVARQASSLAGMIEEASQRSPRFSGFF